MYEKFVYNYPETIEYVKEREIFRVLLLYEHTHTEIFKSALVYL